MSHSKNSRRSSTNDSLESVARTEAQARATATGVRPSSEIHELSVGAIPVPEGPKGSVKSASPRTPAPVLQLVTERVVVQESIVQVLEEWLVLAREGRINELAIAGSLDGTVTVEWEAGDRFLLLGALELCKTRILREITDEDEDDDEE